MRRPSRWVVPRSCGAGGAVHVVSAKEFAPPQPAHVLARREFAGAWEYLLKKPFSPRPLTRIGLEPR